MQKPRKAVMYLVRDIMYCKPGKKGYHDLVDQGRREIYLVER